MTRDALASIAALRSTASYLCMVAGRYSAGDSDIQRGDLQVAIDDVLATLDAARATPTPDTLDVERLARAIWSAMYPDDGSRECMDNAAAIAREYAAATPTPDTRLREDVGAYVAWQYRVIRSALKGARGLAFDEGETDLDAELKRAIDLLDGLT